METIEFQNFKKITGGLAKNIALAQKDSNLSAESLLLVLLKDQNPFSEFFRSSIAPNALEALTVELEENISQENTNPIDKKLFDELNNLPDRYVDELTLVNNWIDQKPFRNAYNILGKYINIEHLKEDLTEAIPTIPNKDWNKKEESILTAFGRDLTSLAQEGELHQIVGRNEEMVRLLSILTRHTKSNPILVGDAGVGKTAIVEKLAEVLLNKEDIPSSLWDYKLIEIEPSKLLSAGAAPGAMEELIGEIITEAKKEKAILFWDEIHVIMDSDARIANLLKPAMARGEIKLIGATTEDEYKVFEKDEAMQRRMAPIKVTEPSKTSVYEILKKKSIEIEDVHNILIPEITMLKAIQLSEKFRIDRNQPDKAIDLLEEAAAKLRMTLESKPEVIIELEHKIEDLQLELEISEIETDIKSERQQVNLKKVRDTLTSKRNELKELQIRYKPQRKLLQQFVQAKEKLAADTKQKDSLLLLGKFNEAIKYEVEIIPEDEKNIQEIENSIMNLTQEMDTNLIQNVVTPEMVARVIEIQTGIPVTAQGNDDLEKYKNIDVTLKAKIHGQDKAIDLITAAIKRSKAGLSDSNKPLGSFLCFGPTGVGKTYLAQQLAVFMFETDKVLHRFDMSEYMEGHSVAKLFGSPPGYVGYGEGGQLTEAVKRNPYSIILFDEIEKAHPRVFDTMLQILDAGRMTDGQGLTVDFKNTIIIMTSNIGSDIIKEGLENQESVEYIEEQLIQEAGNHFRPEFLNRFDAKVMFNALDIESVVKITTTELEKLGEKLLSENDLDLHWHPNIPAWITKQAYNLVDGARPIKRFLNDKVVDLLTTGLLNNTIVKGDAVYIPWAESMHSLTLFSVLPEDLIQINEEAQKDGRLVLKANFSEPPTQADTKKKAKTKKKKQKKEQQASDISINFKTELGD